MVNEVTRGGAAAVATRVRSMRYWYIQWPAAGVPLAASYVRDCRNPVLHTGAVKSLMVSAHDGWKTQLMAGAPTCAICRGTAAWAAAGEIHRPTASARMRGVRVMDPPGGVMKGVG